MHFKTGAINRSATHPFCVCAGLSLASSEFNLLRKRASGRPRNRRRPRNRQGQRPFDWPSQRTDHRPDRTVDSRLRLPGLWRRSHFVSIPDTSNIVDGHRA